MSLHSPRHLPLGRSTFFLKLTHPDLNSAHLDVITLDSALSLPFFPSWGLPSVILLTPHACTRIMVSYFICSRLSHRVHRHYSPPELALILRRCSVSYLSFTSREARRIFVNVESSDWRQPPDPYDLLRKNTFPSSIPRHAVV